MGFLRSAVLMSVLVAIVGTSIGIARADVKASKPASPSAGPVYGPDAPSSLPIEKSEPTAIGAFETAPVIDGKLDEPIWEHAAVLRDYYQIQPGYNIAPTQKTELLVAKDAKNLYLAFKCYDTDPSGIRATIPKRDAIFDDDYVGAYLDTFHDQRRAYMVWFNPNGVQADGIFTEDRGEDYSFDLVMESKGEVGPEGWMVEVRIPFKSLRYEAGEGKVWGLQSFRRIKRVNNELDAWMPMSRSMSGTLNQEGQITGFVGIDTEHTLEMIPSIIFSQTSNEIPADPTLGFVDSRRILTKPIHTEMGLTMKYSITPTVTLDFAANPDFAQVEADQLVITANQRFPIFYEEKRPFFLEGIDTYQTQMNILNTRTIVDPDVAVKLTGKLGRNTFGMILASDNAPGNFSSEERTDPSVLPSILKYLDHNSYVGVLRLKRDIGEESSIGLIATSYSFIEDHNTVGSIDGRFKLNPKTIWDFQVVGTTSRQFFYDDTTRDNVYRTGNGFGYATSYDYTDKNFGYRVTAVGRTADYRANVGYTRRIDTNRDDVFLRWSNDPNPNKAFIGYRIINYGGVNYDWQGNLQNWDVESSVQFNFRRETNLGIGGYGGYERLFQSEFLPYVPASYPSGFSGTDPERSTYKKQIYTFFNSTPIRKLSVNSFIAFTNGSFDYDFGAGPNYPRVSPAALANPYAAYDPGPGNELYMELSALYLPTEALRASVSYIKNKLVRHDNGLTAYDANLVSFRSTYQFTRFAFARVRADYDTLTSHVFGQYLFGWTPNPGTALYIGYNNQLRYNGYSPITGLRDPGVSIENSTFFIKLSYLFRQSI